MFLCGPVGDVRDQPAASRRHQSRGMLTGDECGTDTGGYHGVPPPDPLLPPTPVRTRRRSSDRRVNGAQPCWPELFAQPRYAGVGHHRRPLESEIDHDAARVDAAPTPGWQGGNAGATAHAVARRPIRGQGVGLRRFGRGSSHAQGGRGSCPREPVLRPFAKTPQGR